MTKPFYNIANNKGMGIVFEGTCGFGFGIGEAKGNVISKLGIFPLDHEQKAGERGDDNPIIKDDFKVEMVFTKPESIDVLIKVLQGVKEEQIKAIERKVEHE